MSPLLCVLSFSLVSCSGSKAGKPDLKTATQPLLLDDYEMDFQKDDRKLQVDLVWPARIGRILNTVKIDDLDLESAAVRRIDGGAFRYSHLVSIPTLKPGQVSIQQWDSTPDELPEQPDSTTTSDELWFHCNDEASARKVIELLKAWKSN